MFMGRSVGRFVCGQVCLWVGLSVCLWAGLSVVGSSVCGQFCLWALLSVCGQVCLWWAGLSQGSLNSFHTSFSEWS